MPKLCPNIRFPHQQDFFPIRSVTKSSTSRFSHENLVEKFKIFGQDFVPIRTALLLVFLKMLFLGTCHIFLRASVGTFSRPLLVFIYLFFILGKLVV